MKHLVIANETGRFGSLIWIWTAALMLALAGFMPHPAHGATLENEYQQLMQERQQLFQEAVRNEQAYQDTVYRQLPSQRDAVLVGAYIWRYYFEHHAWPKSLDDLGEDLDFATEFSDWSPFEVTAGEIRFRVTNRKFPGAVLTAHIPLPTKEDARRYRKQKEMRGGKPTLIWFHAGQNPLAHAAQYANWNAASLQRRWALESAYCRQSQALLGRMNRWAGRALRPDLFRYRARIEGMSAGEAGRERRELRDVARDTQAELRDCEREAEQWFLRYEQQARRESVPVSWPAGGDRAARPWFDPGNFRAADPGFTPVPGQAPAGGRLILAADSIPFNPDHPILPHAQDLIQHWHRLDCNVELCGAEVSYACNIINQGGYVFKNLFKFLDKVHKRFENVYDQIRCDLYKRMPLLKYVILFLPSVHRNIVTLLKYFTKDNDPRMHAIFRDLLNQKDNFNVNIIQNMERLMKSKKYMEKQIDKKYYRAYKLLKYEAEGGTIRYRERKRK